MSISRGKTALLIIMLSTSAYYAYTRYQELSPSPAINNGHSDDFARVRHDGPPTPDMEKRRQEFRTALNLTPQQEEQVKQLREANGGRTSFREGMSSFTQILTPAQRSAMAAMRDARRDKGAKAAMSAGDYEKYRQKRDERRRNNPGRGPR